MANSTEIIEKDAFSVTAGKVNNSEIGILHFYVFRNNHDGTYTSVNEYYRGSTYTSFWAWAYWVTPQTYTRDDLLERFKDCEFTDKTSPY